jgi:hypothetical protein
MAVRRSPTVQRRRLGTQLRRIRERAGLTIEQVADVLECSHSKVSRIETGQVAATPRDVRDMLDLYKVKSEEREALIQAAREARQKGWWQAYSDTPVVPLVGLEVAAQQIHQYAAMAVPGLLQTRDYARAITRAVRPDLPPEQIERRVDLRMARQEILVQGNSPAFSAVLEECALRRPVGGHTVMHQQLRHLVEAAALPSVTLQILPLTVGEHAGMSGTFTILGFGSPTDPDVVYLEQNTSHIYLDNAKQVERYVLAFDRLRVSALNSDNSATLLRTLTRELDSSAF